MRRRLALIVSGLVVAASFGALAPAAGADPDSVACTLEKKGLYHSPLGSACAEDPWG